MIDEDATQNDVLSIFQDLISKIQGSEGREGRKEGGEEKEDIKNSKKETKLTLKSSNFRYHRNCFQDFSTKLQINAAKNTCDQTSSDKAPLSNTVTLWGVREGKRGQEEERRMKTEKMLRGETKVALN